MCVFTFTGTLGHTWWAWSTLRLSQSLRTCRNTPGVLPTPWSRGSAPTLEKNPKEPFLCLLIRNSTPALMTPKIPHKYSICFVYPSLRHASRANCVLEWGERGNRSSVSVSSDWPGVTALWSTRSRSQPSHSTVALSSVECRHNACPTGVTAH